MFDKNSDSEYLAGMEKLSHPGHLENAFLGGITIDIFRGKRKGKSGSRAGHFVQKTLYFPHKHGGEGYLFIFLYNL